MSELQILIQIGRRNWWIMALTAGAALLISIILSTSTQPTYQTSARFIIGPNRELDDHDIINSLEALDKRSVVVTYAEVLRSNRILGAALREVDLDAANLVDYELTAVVLPETNVLELTVIGPDPVQTAALANAMGEKAIEYMSRLYPIHRIDFLDKAPEPKLPFAPQPIRNAILSLALGLGLGGLLVIVRERLLQPVAILSNQEAVPPANNTTISGTGLGESTPDNNPATIDNGSDHDFNTATSKTK